MVVGGGWYRLNQKMARDLQYEESFLREHGWCSCYECDIVFTVLDELKKHENIHEKYENPNDPDNRSRS